MDSGLRPRAQGGFLPELVEYLSACAAPSAIVPAQHAALSACAAPLAIAHFLVPAQHPLHESPAILRSENAEMMAARVAIASKTLSACPDLAQGHRPGEEACAIVQLEGPSRNPGARSDDLRLNSSWGRDHTFWQQTAHSTCCPHLFLLSVLGYASQAKTATAPCCLPSATARHTHVEKSLETCYTNNLLRVAEPTDHT